MDASEQVKPADLRRRSSEGLGVMVIRDTDDESMGDFWHDSKAARQEKRASNRTNSAELLREAGIAFEAKNIDAHLIVRHAGCVIDFWPGTGLWMVRGGPTRRYGVRSLISFFRQRQAPNAALRGE